MTTRVRDTSPQQYRVDQENRHEYGRRWVPLALAAVMVLPLGVGCGKHRRGALRPVFGGVPIVTAPGPLPCPPGQDCGGAGSISAPASVPAPIRVEPGFESGETLSAPSGVDSIRTPATVSPPAAPLSEPELDPELAPTRVETPPPSSSLPSRTRSSIPPAAEDDPIPDPVRPDDIPPLMAPQASRARRPAVLPGGAQVRTATQRTRVESYVNDPGDLFQPPKAERRWQYIVVHHSAHPAGSYAQIDRDHRERLGTAGCGYHFVIGNGSDSEDGLIEVTQRWSDQKAGAHCRDADDPAMNDYGIGICLIGDLDAGEPTPRQVAAAQALVEYLRTQYNIPAPNVGTHAQLAQKPTSCPGRHFPSAAVLGRDRSGNVAAAR